MTGWTTERATGARSPALPAAAGRVYRPIRSLAVTRKPPRRSVYMRAYAGGRMRADAFYWEHQMRLMEMTCMPLSWV